MLNQPSQKYRTFLPVKLLDRTWPDAVLDPRTDLAVHRPARRQPGADRADGHRPQAAMFDTLVAIGFKEIEVGFPSASQTDFDFVRKLIEEDRIPDDVTIQVLTQAREPLDRAHVRGAAGRAARHRASLQRDGAGDAPRGVRHGRRRDRRTRHHACPAVQRRLPPGSRKRSGRSSTRRRCSPAPSSPSRSAWSMRSPQVWAPTPARKCIINLPSTVEHSTPNIFADMIEWMHRHLARRDAIVLSVHPHNDRGTGTAAGEFAMMAGADRIEGCLFGNGERTGNVDLVNVALNLYTQGVASGLDFSQHRRDPARPSSIATSCRCIRAIRMSATWSTPRSPARTRTRSRRPSRRARKATSGTCRTCRSTRRTSAAATRR